MNKKLQILMIFLMIPVLSFSAEDEPSEAYIIGVINRYLKDKQKLLNHKRLISKSIFHEDIADEEELDNSIKREVVLQNYILGNKWIQSNELLMNLKNGGYIRLTQTQIFMKFVTADGSTTWIPIQEYEQAKATRAREATLNASRTAALNDFLGNELSPEESKYLSVEERIRRRNAYEAQKAAERNKGWFNWLWS